MKILIYGINFSPELTGIGKYTGEMADWLASAGHEVRVVTAPPYYPEWKVHSEYRNRYSTENINGVSVSRAPLWVPYRPSGAKRLLHLMSFAISSIPSLFQNWGWKPDVVWTVEPALFCSPFALLFAKLRGSKIWLHVQDYELDAAFEMGILKGALLRRLASSIENSMMRRFDRVSTISSRMLDRAADKGVPQERLIAFPNWVDTSAISPMSSMSNFRQLLRIPSTAVVALYSGNMGGKQGLEILAQVAEVLKDDAKIQFVLCGNGAGKDALVASCATLKNVHFLDLQPLECLNDLLGTADIHLLPQRADAADLVMPSKLTGMLSSGRPVIATAHLSTELGKVVMRCGLIVPPGDALAFAEAIQQLANSPERRVLLGNAARAYAEAELDRDAVLGRFEQDLQNCLKQ